MATLGPSFKVDLERPRDRAAINHDQRFIELRNEITKYLIELKEEHEGSLVRRELTCPDIEPLDLRITAA
jgi:nitrate/nitrite transport system ATP-binding protein